MAVTRESLLQFFSDTFDLEPEELENDAPIFSQGLLDSFNLVDLVGFLEKQLGQKIGAMEVNLNNLDTLGRILEFAEKKAAG